MRTAHLFVLTALGLTLPSLSACSSGDTTSGGSSGADGDACSSGSDCGSGFYCVLLDGSKTGTCHATPSSCTAGSKCSDCDAYKDPCGDRISKSCASIGSQVTVSCEGMNGGTGGGGTGSTGTM